MIKAIVFDFDGVLVDSVGIKTSAYLALFSNEKAEVIEKIRKYHCKNMGVSRFEKFAHIYEKILKRQLTESGLNRLCQRFSSLVKKEIVAAPYIGGAREFLDNHSSLYKCFIVSATPQDEIKEIVEKRKMEQYFIGIYGSPADKAKIIEDILSETKLPNKRIAYIGDSLTDYQAAKKNAINFIAKVENGNSPFSKKWCLKVKDLTDLKKILDKFE